MSGSKLLCGLLLALAAGLGGRGVEPRSLYSNIAVSPDGSMVAETGEFYEPDRAYAVYLFSLKDGGLLSTIRGSANEGMIYSVAFSPDSRMLLVNGRDMFRRIELVSGKDVAALPGSDDMGNPREAVFSRDGRYLEVLGAWGFAVWDLRTNQLVVNEPIDAARNDPPSGLAITPDGEVMTARNSAMLFRYNWRTKVHTDKPFTAKYQNVAIAFSPDGKTEADLERLASPDGVRQPTKLVIRSLVTGKVRMTISDESEKAEYTRLAYSTDGKVIALGGDSPLGLFVVGKNKIEQQGVDCDSPQFMGDGRDVVCSDGKGVIRVWDVGLRKVVRTIEVPAAPVK